MYSWREIRALYLIELRAHRRQDVERPLGGYRIEERGVPRRRPVTAVVGAKYRLVVPLLKQGLTISEIARRTGFDRKTIRRYQRLSSLR